MRLQVHGFLCQEMLSIFTRSASSDELHYKASPGTVMGLYFKNRSGHQESCFDKKTILKSSNFFV